MSEVTEEVCGFRWLVERVGPGFMGHPPTAVSLNILVHHGAAPNAKHHCDLDVTHTVAHHCGRCGRDIDLELLPSKS